MERFGRAVPDFRKSDRRLGRSKQETSIGRRLIREPHACAMRLRLRRLCSFSGGASDQCSRASSIRTGESAAASTAASGARTTRPGSARPRGPRGQPCGSRPAFIIRCRMNSRGSATCRQTLGRNRARRRPAPRMSPSRSGSSPADELGFAFRRNRARVGEDRDVDFEPLEFGFRQAREARIGVASLDRVGHRVLDQRRSGRRRSDAAAQLALL